MIDKTKAANDKTIPTIPSKGMNKHIHAMMMTIAPAVVGALSCVVCCVVIFMPPLVGGMLGMTGRNVDPAGRRTETFSSSGGANVHPKTVHPLFSLQQSS